MDKPNKQRDTELKQKLVNFYGADFKSPLARDLKVNVSTVRRIFNQREEIPEVYRRAIENIISESPAQRAHRKSNRKELIDDIERREFTKEIFDE